MAPVLKRMPNRIKITGHSDATKFYNSSGYSLWELTADRANAARRILNKSGVADDRFFAANRRISIVILREAPPLPLDHKL